MPDSPFAEYLRAIDAQLAGLPPARREAIRRELLAHLEDAAADAGADPHDPALQAAVIAQLGPADDLAGAFGAVHGALPGWLRQMARLAGLVGGLMGVFGGLMAGSLGTVSAWGLAITGGIALAGAVQPNRQRGALMMLVCGAVLAAAGALVHHGLLGRSFDLLAGALLLFGGEFLLLAALAQPALLRLPRIRRWLAALVALVLVSFVPPFSYLPNPLGVYYFVRGYSYDPRQPFVNRFATLGTSPVPLVAARLEQLIGKTGLDPLDAQSPLVRYELVRVVTQPLGSLATVEAQLHYADGSQRSYLIPTQQYGDSPRVEVTGIDRVLAEHRALPGLPPADGASPLRLGMPARLPLGPAAQTIFSDNDPYAGSMSDNVQWYPGGFLMQHGDVLWRVPTDGSAPEQVATNIATYASSADGRAIALAQHDPNRPWSHYQIVIVDVVRGERRVESVADQAALAARGEWFFFIQGKQLWRVPTAGGAAERLASLPGAGADTDVSPLAVAPAGQRVAYRCGNDLCLADTDGANPARIGLGYSTPEPALTAQPDSPPSPMPTSGPLRDSLPYLGTLGLAWNPDGRVLAVASGPTDDRGHPELRFIAADGQIIRTIPVGPDGMMAAPQWLPGGSWLLLTTYPAGGRRIIAVAPATGTVLDLSQPRWDTFASLMPSGHDLLLWNGRGSFWHVPLLEL